MAFNFPAFTYIVALIIDVCLIFFAIFHVIAFDELKTDYKNPIDQCNSLNPLVVPEYLLHLLFNILFIASGEWFSLCLNIPLIAYHIKRYRSRPNDILFDHNVKHPQLHKIFLEASSSCIINCPVSLLFRF
ncbi:Protein cornichon [Gryllus bimaculatus]|nr:Protein cornichon [Gryllus bimaculatus]